MSTPDFNPEDCQCSKFHYETLKAYLPPSVMARLELHGLSKDTMDSVKTEDYLKGFFDKGAFDLRRYGSIQELAQFMKSFRKFIGADRELGADDCQRFDRRPSPYKDGNDDSWISKQDAVVMLQQHFSNVYYFMPENLSTAVLSAFLKNYEKENLAERLEFVASGSELKSSFIVLPDGFEEGFFYPKKYDFEGILECIKLILIPNFDNLHHARIIQILNVMCVKTPPEANVQHYKGILRGLNTMIRNAKKAMARNPTVFLLDEKTRSTFWTKPSKPQTPLRMFHDDTRRFVMLDELRRVEIPMRRDSSLYIQTMDGESAEKMTRQETSANYICCPIQRDIHNAQPIRTAYEGYCKLAVDLLFQVVDELIFGSKIFQKLQASEWKMVEDFFTEQKFPFNPDEKNIYFVRLSDFKADESMRNSFFNSIVNRPAKQIRNAKADGFTVENLKNELVKQLELNRLFPEIESYAEIAYDYVVKEKKKPVLRTCDLFEAIKQCILIALFQRLPNLSTFLHKQNGCHRVLLNTCCSESPLPDIPRPPVAIRPPLPKDPKWKSIKVADVKLEDLVIKGDVMFSRKMICPDGLELYYNDCVLDMLMSEQYPDHPTVRMKRYEEMDITLSNLGSWEKVLLLSQEDIEILRRNMLSPETLFKVCKSLLHFVQMFPEKRIYLRYFSWFPNEKDREEVFIDEVIDILFFVKRLMEPVDLAVAGKIGEFWMNWREEGKPELIRLAELKDILRRFDFDESLITLVPDLSHANDRLYKMPLNIGFPKITTITPQRQEKMDKGQALFRIFQLVVCDVDWRVEVDGCKGESSKEHFKDAVVNVMKACANQPILIPVAWADEHIKQLKAHPNYLQRKKKNMVTPHILLYDADFNDTISLSYFLFLAKQLSFPSELTLPPSVSEEDLADTAFPVWKMRIQCLLDWIQIFFTADSDQLLRTFASMVVDLIYQRVPLVEWNGELKVWVEVFHSVDDEQLEHAKKLEFLNAGVFHPIYYHEFLPTSWKDRTYINRCSKWAVRESLKHVIEAPQSLEKVIQLKNASTNIYVELLETKDEALRVEEKTIELLQDIFDYMRKKFRETAGTAKKPIQVLYRNPASRSKKKDEVGRKLSETIHDELAAVSLVGTSTEVRETSMETLALSPTTSSQGSSKPEAKTVPENYEPLIPTKPFTYPQPRIPKKPEVFSSSSTTTSSQGSSKAEAKRVPENKENKKPSPKDCKTSDPLSQKLKKLENQVQTLKAENEKMKQRVAQADKNEKSMKKREKAMKPVKDLEKEIREKQKRIEELEQEKQGQAEKDAEFEKKLLAANKIIEELTAKNTELQKFNKEKDERIAEFKEKLSKEELKTSNFGLSTEMKKELAELQDKLNFIRDTDPIGNASSLVHELKIATSDQHVQGGGDYVLLKFKMEFNVYEAAIERNIGIIQADTTVTRSELVEVPAFPELPPVFFSELKKARDKKNAEKAQECLICLVDDDKEYFYCPNCPIKAHPSCLAKWWAMPENQGSKKCPHCLVILNV